MKIEDDVILQLLFKFQDYYINSYNKSEKNEQDSYDLLQGLRAEIDALLIGHPITLRQKGGD
jgi:hypothetical protein